MKLTLITIILLLGFASTGPALSDDGSIIITKDFFNEDLVVHKSTHDIVNVVVPLNSLNFDDEDLSEKNLNSKDAFSNVTVFFAEADIDDLGKRTYKGLYALKNRKATKILENGVDAAASGDKSKSVYLAATDGIYVYSPEHQTPVKYGSISDSVIGIAHEAESEVFYILTADHFVYKVLDNGNKKEKLEDAIDAQQIVLDYSNNLYFYTSDKKVFIKNSEGVKEVEGLPENPSKYTLVKPPMVFDEGVVWIADGIVYIVHANGRAEEYGIKIDDDVVPTGFGSEPSVVQYYAHNKKIYEYNIQSMIAAQAEEELKNLLGDRSESRLLQVEKARSPQK